MHRALGDGNRMRMMRILRGTSEPLDAHELARQLGLHVTTVRAHLDVLVDVGLVVSQTEDRTTPGRPRRLYRALTDGASATDTRGYRLLAQMLASHVAGSGTDVAQRTIITGRAWGSYLVDRPPPYAAMPADTARAEILHLLDRLGFDPRSDDVGSRIMLRRCPFIDVARGHPDVVCSLHLGLIQGALETLRAPLEARDLEPFVEPSLCVAHITSTTTDPQIS